MQRTTQSVLFAVAFLGLAEFGLRHAEEVEKNTDRLAAAKPIVFFLGTSRTEFGIKPAEVEATLRTEGIDAWTANVTRRGSSMVGLFQAYLDEIHPFVAGHDVEVILGIEVRGSGMNDNRIERGEIRALRELKARVPAAEAEIELPDPIALAAEGELDKAASTVFETLSLLRGRQQVGNSFSQLWSSLGATRTGNDWFEHTNGLRPWAKADKGWGVHTDMRRDDLNWEARERAHSSLLQRFQVGGVQTAGLRQILREAQAIGIRPFVYTLPVTAQHRRFFLRGHFERYMRLVAKIAENHGVPFVDLDTDHGLGNEAFHDTDHLHASASREVSARMARRALLPLLETR